jgi:RNA recognition motif-containing protein
MIRNIPNLYTQQELIAELEELGFQGTFDFLYSPLDKCTLSNVGYAFVNFVSNEWARRCITRLRNHAFKRHSSKVRQKVASVSVAHIQGLEKNLAHYENTAINSSKLKRCRPVVLQAASGK